MKVLTTLIPDMEHLEMENKIHFGSMKSKLISFYFFAGCLALLGEEPRLTEVSDLNVQSMFDVSFPRNCQESYLYYGKASFKSVEKVFLMSLFRVGEGSWFFARAEIIPDSVMILQIRIKKLDLTETDQFSIEKMPISADQVRGIISEGESFFAYRKPGGEWVVINNPMVENEGEEFDIPPIIYFMSEYPRF